MPQQSIFVCGKESRQLQLVIHGFDLRRIGVGVGSVERGLDICYHSFLVGNLFLFLLHVGVDLVELFLLRSLTIRGRFQSQSLNGYRLLIRQVVQFGFSVNQFGLFGEQPCCCRSPQSDQSLVVFLTVQHAFLPLCPFFSQGRRNISVLNEVRDVVNPVCAGRVYLSYVKVVRAAWCHSSY